MACATTGGVKEDIGTIIGAVGGVALGALVGGKKHRTEGAIIGGLLGSLLGNRIGSVLDERDRRALKVKTEEALRTGRRTTWKSDHTDATAVIQPIQETIKTKAVNIKKDPDVIMPSSPINPASGIRQTTATLNVRKGPGTVYDVVNTLPKGAKISLNGVTDNGWYLISKNNVVLGYVAGNYLIGINNPIYSPTEPQVSISKSPIEDTAIVKVKCRTVKVFATVKGEVIEDQVETCQDPNPKVSWGA